MKIYFNFAITAILFLSLSVSVSAQKSVKEGSIKFEITSIEPSSPETDMMKGSRMELAFDKKNQKMEMSMMGGLVEVKTYTDMKSEVTTMLMNMMGNKTKVEMSKEEADKQKEEMPTPNYKISIDKSDTKEIIGYQCYKAVLTGDDGNQLELYCTEEIKPKLKYFTQTFPGLDAFPMEYSVKNAGITMTFSAIEFVDKLPKDAFNINDEGYTSMTMEEFQKQMGGMGSMGF